MLQRDHRHRQVHPKWWTRHGININNIILRSINSIISWIKNGLLCVGRHITQFEPVSSYVQHVHTKIFYFFYNLCHKKQRCQSSVQRNLLIIWLFSFHNNWLCGFSMTFNNIMKYLVKKISLHIFLFLEILWLHLVTQFWNRVLLYVEKIFFRENIWKLVSYTHTHTHTHIYIDTHLVITQINSFKV